LPSTTFERLYEEYGDYLWRSLRLLGVPRHLLEDACQDSLVIIHRQLPSFEGRSTIKTCIWGIAEHVAANSHRTQRRKSAPLQPLSELSEPAVAAHGDAVEAAEVMQRFCASLDDEGRALFVLALF
jgi:RNA polymerase sigma-70 factor (ECF subfamily)